MVNFIREYLYMLDDLTISKVKESACLSILLEIVEKIIGISSENIMKGLIRALLLFILLAYGPTIFINTLVVLYPAYLSFQSIEYGDNHETTRWMKYWIVFGMLRAIENIAGPLIWWIPGYIFFKFLFLLWCLAPREYNGSVMVYESYLRPAFLQHSETVDNVLRSFKNITTRCRL